MTGWNHYINFTKLYLSDMFEIDRMVPVLFVLNRSFYYSEETMMEIRGKNLEATKELPFMLAFYEEVDLQNPSYCAAGGTSYSTNSGGRETEYDEDP